MNCNNGESINQAAPVLDDRTPLPPASKALDQPFQQTHSFTRTGLLRDEFNTGNYLK